MPTGTNELGEFAYTAYYAELLKEIGGEFPPFDSISEHIANAWRAAAKAVADEQVRRRKDR